MKNSGCKGSSVRASAGGSLCKSMGCNLLSNIASMRNTIPEFPQRDKPAFKKITVSPRRGGSAVLIQQGGFFKYTPYSPYGKCWAGEAGREYEGDHLPPHCVSAELAKNDCVYNKLSIFLLSLMKTI